MQLLKLRDEAEAARRYDERAVSLLEAAQDRLTAADEEADRTAKRFAEALDRLGGRVVDLSSNPPMLYTVCRDQAAAHPVGYEAHPVALVERPTPIQDDDPITIGPVS